MPIPDSPLVFGSLVCYVCDVKVSRDCRCDELEFLKTNTRYAPVRASRTGIYYSHMPHDELNMYFLPINV